MKNLKRTFVVVLLACLMLPNVLSARTWTSKKGAKLEAEFVGLNGKKVILRKKSGRITGIKLSSLSEEDQAFAKEQAGIKGNKKGNRRKGKSTAGGAPYVDSKAIKERFKEITADDMKLLRSKKILFASRSFGLNLYKGLGYLKKEDKKYDLLSSFKRYDVFKAGGDLSVIPADAFDQANFVHFMATYWPHTVRVDEMDTLLRKAPHKFGEKADIVVIYFHTARPKVFEYYSEKMDKLRSDFPNITFIYVTAGLMGPSRKKENTQAHEFSEKIRKQYKGKVPLYDLGAILSDDFRVGQIYCPEYSKDPADVHPNQPAGEMMMAKGFLLILKEALSASPGTATVKKGKTKKSGSVKKAATLTKNHPDYKAVRAILDKNGLKKKKVESVAVVKNGRVTELYLQEGGITQISNDIGKLTELTVLHLYGDRNLDYPLLKKISPAIGKCVKLEDLLLNSNELKSLPVEITKLQKLTSLSLADNRLRNLPEKVQKWAEKFDAKGLKQQGK